MTYSQIITRRTKIEVNKIIDKFLYKSNNLKSKNKFVVVKKIPINTNIKENLLKTFVKKNVSSNRALIA